MTAFQIAAGEVRKQKPREVFAKPFPVRRKKMSAELMQAIADSRERRNLHGPFDTAEEAVASMLVD